MLAEFKQGSLRDGFAGGFSRVFRLCTPFLLPVGCLGALLAPSVVVSLQFQILHWLAIRPPAPIYWILAGLVLVFSVWIFSRVGTALLRWYKQGWIWLEGGFLFLGVALAIAVAIWLLPSGWFA